MREGIYGFAIVGSFTAVHQVDGHYGMLFTASVDFAEMDVSAKLALLAGVEKLTTQMIADLEDELKKETN